MFSQSKNKGFVLEINYILLVLRLILNRQRNLCLQSRCYWLYLNVHFKALFKYFFYSEHVLVCWIENSALVPLHPLFSPASSTLPGHCTATKASFVFSQAPSWQADGGTGIPFSHRATFSQPSAPVLPLTASLISSLPPQPPTSPGWSVVHLAITPPCDVLTGQQAAGAHVCFRLGILFYNACTDEAPASLWPMSSVWTGWFSKSTYYMCTCWVSVCVMGSAGNYSVWRQPWTELVFFFILHNSVHLYCCMWQGCFSLIFYKNCDELCC